jgi:hypothetical protein
MAEVREETRQHNVLSAEELKTRTARRGYRENNRTKKLPRSAYCPDLSEKISVVTAAGVIAAGAGTEIASWQLPAVRKHAGTMRHRYR